MAKNRILLVEDEEAIAKMIAVNLRFAKYEVELFENGLDAAEAMEGDHHFDLALLDVMLPGMDGFALLEVMKQYEIPVIFLTAKDDVGSKVQGLKGGAEDYMVKPFEVLELLVRIEKVLERTGKSSQVIQIGDIEIDVAAHRVRKGREEILLKPKEFELLCVLAKNVNMVISRENLLKVVWGVDFLGETRTVDVHIGQLRKKLGLSEQIKTVPKLGYRLEE